MIDLIKLILENKGYQVLGAEGGRHGLDTCQAELVSDLLNVWLLLSCRPSRKCRIQASRGVKVLSSCCASAVKMPIGSHLDAQLVVSLWKGKQKMFQIGDTVIHPDYGAGTVVKIEELQCLGSNDLYYSIELSDGSKARVWVSVSNAEKKGIRYPTRKSQLVQIWHVLRAGPEMLPPDHKERYESLQDKLRGGDIFRIAEVVRDMFWEDHRSHKLTISGKELYDRGLMFLTSEVAVAQGCDFTAAGAMISNILGASLAAEPAA